MPNTKPRQTDPSPQALALHSRGIAGVRLATHAGTAALLLGVMGISLVGVGCASSSSTSSYGPVTEAARNPAEADRLNAKAADLMHSEPVEAEKILRDALTADLYHGPAHNNLGVLYLKQGKLFEAAGEFQWARQLLPGHPDPRLNLALTLESAGKVDEAIATYKTALEVYPNHLQSTQALARLQVRFGKTDATTPVLLEEIAMRGENQRWKDWARMKLAGLRGP